MKNINRTFIVNDYVRSEDYRGRVIDENYEHYYEFNPFTCQQSGDRGIILEIFSRIIHETDRGFVGTTVPPYYFRYYDEGYRCRITLHQLPGYRKSDSFRYIIAEYNGTSLINTDQWLSLQRLYFAYLVDINNDEFNQYYNVENKRRWDLNAGLLPEGITKDVATGRAGYNFHGLYNIFWNSMAAPYKINEGKLIGLRSGGVEQVISNMERPDNDGKVHYSVPQFIYEDSDGVLRVVKTDSGITGLSRKVFLGVKKEIIAGNDKMVFKSTRLINLPGYSFLTTAKDYKGCV